MSKKGTESPLIRIRVSDESEIEEDVGQLEGQEFLFSGSQPEAILRQIGRVERIVVEEVTCILPIRFISMIGNEISHINADLVEVIIIVPLRIVICGAEVRSIVL